MKIERSHAVNADTVNQRLRRVNYAVRGPLLARALQLEDALKKGDKLPFDQVVRANIGDCHALGQPPITFLRQLLALVAWPSLLEKSPLPAPPDVVERARRLLRGCTRGSVGAYSPSSGLAAVRDSVVAYIQRRDGGVPADPDQVYLGSGATDLIRAVLALLAQPVDGKPPGVMIPIPQYPVFSGALAELGIEIVPYYLDEDHNWALSVTELERAFEEASKDIAVRALVVINPGNPTGQVFSRDNVEEVIRFVHSKQLLLLADEVYQENIVSKPFHSIKKVAHKLGKPYSDMELASFFTCSKGWAAECGLRAGYVELIGLDPVVRRAFESSRALGQCPGVLGQCLLECAVNPPQPGDASYKLFTIERQRLQKKLEARTTTAQSALSSIPGYSCNPIEGSMFAFPRIEIPTRAVAEASRRGMLPDEFYCLRLLEETGVFVVPGSGFGQRPGTYHFRTTILHEQEELEHMLNSFRDFHCKFLERYSQ